MKKKKENKLGSKDEVYIKNRFGLIEPIYEQCDKTCRCQMLKEECRSDKLFFGVTYMFNAYRENMQKRKKK